MNQDFFLTWDLVRGRFLASLDGLSPEQLNWRLHSGALTIGEMSLHVAGVERWFIAQLLRESVSPEEDRLMKAARDGVINDSPFPYSPEEITPDLVRWALATSGACVKPVIQNLTDELRARTITSALGPEIDGAGCMARLAYHPAYHHAQVYLIRTAPGFPA